MKNPGFGVFRAFTWSLCIFVPLCLSVSISSAAPAWKEGWIYRTTLKCGTGRDTAPVERTAAFQFIGSAKEDGSDFRIVNEKGEDIPCVIVWSAGGNRYEICFPAEEDTYYLYHGNNKQYYEPCILFLEAKISGPQTIRSAADVLR